MPDGGDGWPPIGAHRLLSNGRSLALVTPTAEVSWWCAPEPDSPPAVSPGWATATAAVAASGTDPD